MPKALRLKSGDHVVIDLEAAQEVRIIPCQFCHQTMAEDELRALFRNFAEGEWTVGPRNPWITCPYCLRIKPIQKDFISLIAAHAVKSGHLISPYLAVPRRMVKPAPSSTAESGGSCRPPSRAGGS